MADASLSKRARLTTRATCAPGKQTMPFRSSVWLARMTASSDSPRNCAVSVRTHGHRDIGGGTRSEPSPLEHTQKHRQAAWSIAASDDDGFQLRLAELVRDLGEHLIMELRVASDRVGERVHPMRYTTTGVTDCAVLT
jgi:hypothetical protein